MAEMMDLIKREDVIELCNKLAKKWLDTNGRHREAMNLAAIHIRSSVYDLPPFLLTEEKVDIAMKEFVKSISNHYSEKDSIRRAIISALSEQDHPERGAFEKWQEENGNKNSLRKENGSYVNPLTAASWSAWQERAKRHG